MIDQIQDLLGNVQYFCNSKEIAHPQEIAFECESNSVNFVPPALRDSIELLVGPSLILNGETPHYYFINRGNIAFEMKCHRPQQSRHILARCLDLDLDSVWSS